MASSSLTMSIKKIWELMIVFFVALATFIGLLRLVKRRIMPLRDVAMPHLEAGATLGACSFCARFCVRRCSRCKAAPYYCSGLCQFEDWKSGHKYECVKKTADQERVRFLQEELAKSKIEIAKLKSECNSFVRREPTTETEAVQQIAEEEARVTKRNEQDDRVQMLESGSARLRTELEEQIVSALNDVKNATSRAEKAESECAKMKKERREYKKLVQRLELELNEAQTASSKVEKINKELVTALNDAENATTRAENAESECAEMKKELREHKKLVQRLKPKHDESQILKKKVEEINQELLAAFNDVAHAKSRADIAENKYANQRRELQELRELVEKLTLEKEEAKRKVDEASQNLANALNGLNIVEPCVICWTNKRETAFGCGHMTCQSCGESVDSCPICRTRIRFRIKLYFQ